MTDGYGTLGDSGGTATNNGHRPDDDIDEEYLRAVLADDEFGGSLPAGKVLDHLVQQELQKLRARAAARRALRAETRPPIPDLVMLREFLAVPDEPARYRIDELMPVGARVLLAAQYKAGKTTAMGNYLRSLADGDPFLDRFAVTIPAGRIALIDNEMDERALRRWLREQGVRNPDRIVLVSLRGRVSSFDLTDPDVLEVWADRLRGLGVSVVVLDCLRPVLDALGLDENTEVGQFLVPFDEMLARAGADEATVVHHMGHVGERARGASRLIDWPDATWKIVRQDEDPASARFFSAYGRDVNVPESQLAYDHETRRLSIAGGSRRDAAVVDTVPAVLDLLPPDRADALSGRQVEEALVAESGPTRASVRGALKLAVADGLVATAPGPKRATLHWLTNPSAPVRRSAPPVRQRTQCQCASAPIEGALTQHTADCPSAPPLCERCRREPAAVLGRCRTCAYPTETDTDEETER